MPLCHHFSRLCRLWGPIVHIGLGRLDVERIADAGIAGAVGELPCARELSSAGIGRHEGASPAKTIEIGGRYSVDTPLKRFMNESRSECVVLMRLMVPSVRPLGS